MNIVAYYIIGLISLNSWAIYRLIRIFYYESHKYEKDYIQAKYLQGKTECYRLAMSFMKKRSRHALRMNNLLQLLKNTNQKFHDWIAKRIIKTQIDYTGQFEKQFHTDMAMVQKKAQTYYPFVGERIHDFID